MAANVEAMVREGVNAFKAGRREEARALLLKATEIDQYNEQAWLWLSGLMETPEDQRTCLENVLAINPNNERAKQGLSYLTGQTSAGNVSPFSASAPPPAPSPTAPSAPSTPSAPTSVEWGAADEPAAAPAAWNKPPPVEPTPSVLDDWVTNLNLPVNDATPSFMNTDFESNTTSPFGDFDMDDDDGDIFSSSPFGTAPAGFEDVPEAPDPPAPSRRVAAAAPPPDPEPVPMPERTRRARIAPPPDTEGSLLYNLDSDRNAVAVDSGEGEMFGYIPPEIAATRLPGTREHLPVLLVVGVIVLVLLNLAMAVVVMWSVLT